jgi:hypothetical protein
MMNEQGFPKNPIIRKLTGETMDKIPPCTSYFTTDHSFRPFGVMKKIESVDGSYKPGRKDIIITYGIHVCQHCLLHVFVESQRITDEEEEDAQAKSTQLHRLQ